MHNFSNALEAQQVSLYSTLIFGLTVVEKIDTVVTFYQMRIGDALRYLWVDILLSPPLSAIVSAVDSASPPSALT